MSITGMFRIAYENEKMLLLDVDGNLYENEIVSDYSQDDIIQIEGDEVRLIYNGNEHFGTIFITNHCNSSCIMCPDSDSYRSRKSDYKLRNILDFIALLPDDIEGLDITGGEPTLVMSDLPVIIKSIYEKKKYIAAMLLSNGRSFADLHYAEMFGDYKKKGFYVEIPVHGSYALLHDQITRVGGGFEQTVAGIKNLLKLGIRVGIRIVVSRVNYKDVKNIIHLISERFPEILYVNIMGMECLGNAYSNLDIVWIDFDQIGEVIEEATEECVKLGIEPRLYNFPLCIFNEKYWGCYRKSITPEKVRYMDECEFCKEKQECGGFFNSTIKITKFRPERRG